MAFIGLAALSSVAYDTKGDCLPAILDLCVSQDNDGSCAIVQHLSASGLAQLGPILAMDAVVVQSEWCRTATWRQSTYMYVCFRSSAFGT